MARMSAGSRAATNGPATFSILGDLLSVVLTKRPISNDEARAAAQRLSNSHFNNPLGEHGRTSFPANPDRDDHLILMAYIEQRRSQAQ